ncbi:MAG TPA: RNA polymerase sigma factor [Kofleriaceae bacterium]|nr:RNA polymerase sigma factor [Kofleriaceae bacterium]
MLRSVLAEATPALQRIAERLCAGSSDGDDLVQDTIERVLKHGLPVDVQSPVAWLVRMMHNLFIDRCRSAARAPHHEQIDDTHDNITPIDADSQEPMWSRVTIDDLWKALDEVSAPFREVYILHSFERQSYDEIAAKLRISTVTVGTRLTRVRERLRKILVKRVGQESKT